MSRKSSHVPRAVDAESTPSTITDDLIRSINSNFGSRIAYNLSRETSPTHVKQWVSTGSRQLDTLISNSTSVGGLPVGRIVEIFGPPGIGKSHIAIQVAKSAQKMGGIVVYIDTENATSVQNLGMLGVDISDRFVYIDEHCTESILSIVEATILRARAMGEKSDIPITIIWDSVAASSPKAELEGDYDQNSVGLQARAISKGMRKIVGVLAHQNVLFVCINQTRTAIGVMYGDPVVVPGGKAIPYHASVRIKLSSGQKIEDKGKNVIGINVSATVIKNKISAPFRSCQFQIIFGRGIQEHEQLFDFFNGQGKIAIDGDLDVEIGGDGQSKKLTVFSSKTGEVKLEKSFRKSMFDKIMIDPACKHYVDQAFERVMVRQYTALDSASTDAEPSEDEDGTSSNLVHA